MYTKEDLSKIFKEEETQQDSFFDSLELEFFDGLDTSKFALLGTMIKNPTSYFRFTDDDLKSFISVNENLKWIGMNSSGLKLRFKTNSRVIKIKVEENGEWDIYNMTFYSQNGFDLYYFDKELNKWIYHNSSTPTYFERKKYTSVIGKFKNNDEKEILLHFPLYTSVINLKIGLEKGSYAAPINYKSKDQIAFYGTSILQGGAVSRPGLQLTNVISRHLDIDCLNFGFSGNAFLETEMAEAISKNTNIKIIFIDPEANAGYDDRLLSRLNDFIETIYKNNPSIKIVLMNKTFMALDDRLSNYEKSKKFYDEFMQNFVKTLQNQGKNIVFIDNYHLFDNELLDKSEYTVDGCHPNDLGMNLLTKNYLKVIENIK